MMLVSGSSTNSMPVVWKPWSRRDRSPTGTGFFPNDYQAAADNWISSDGVNGSAMRVVYPPVDRAKPPKSWATSMAIVAGSLVAPP